jgi:hypothetical protein
MSRVKLAWPAMEAIQSVFKLFINGEEDALIND